MLEGFLIYCLVGFIIGVTLLLKAEKEKSDSPLVFMFGGAENPYMFLAFFVLWPFWLALHILGREAVKREKEAAQKMKVQKELVASTADLPRIGDKLQTVSDLRPQGLARLATGDLDVSSESGFIGKGCLVEVTGYSGDTVKVRAV